MFNNNQKYIKTLFKNNKHIVIAIIFIAIILLSIGTLKIVNNIVEKIQAAKLPPISYSTYQVKDNCGTALVIIYNENGIKNIRQNDFEIESEGKDKVAFDFKMEDGVKYDFYVTYKNGVREILTIDYEIPARNGLYTYKNGIYVNEPDVGVGIVQEKTRYLYLNENGYLTPGNWIMNDEPENWYDYKERKWANIFVENKGVESYYVWIPRYCYKNDTENSVVGNERMDIKFINTRNQYIDGETGEITEWNELQQQGYKLPEAFAWNAQYEFDVDTQIPGYWMSKYQLGNLESYGINYKIVATNDSITIKHINTTQEDVAKYTYAINGVIVNESEDGSDYTINELSDLNQIINVTALNANGEIVGSMTKSIDVIDVNAPDLQSFDKDTTFYVYWDSNGLEHNEIPISKEPPANWYNYSISNWANIVTRNNGLETYYVWIPRYQYALDETNQESSVKFIDGTSTQTENGYKIPEAFWWDNNGNGIEDEGEQLTGYWISKYQLGISEAHPRVTADILAGNTTIRVTGVSGTALTTTDEDENTIDVPIICQYYIDGNFKYETSDKNEEYVFENLQTNQTYTVNIIVRNAETNEYIGAVTKKIDTKGVNTPDISKFNKDTTFYVTFNDDGTEKERKSINEEPMEDWYDYSKGNWANIVTTANGTESYFVWIPRFQYYLNKSTQKSSIVFIEGTSNEPQTGYTIPEAFWWDNNGNGAEDDGEQLTGYWMSKYQLDN